MRISGIFLSILILHFWCGYIWGQAKLPDSTVHVINKKWYQTGLFKATAVPVLFIGYGISTIKNHGFYSSYHAQYDVHKLYPHYRTHVDDFLQFAPYAELAFLNIFKVSCKNDLINTALLIGKSELVMWPTVYVIKKLTHIQRPDRSDYLSFPSGHTAHAFLAASIVHKEFQHKSTWFGVIGYAIATSVGVFRMLNNKHWESDVFAGAGIGMLSVHMVYLTHRYRWGKNVCLMPLYRKGMAGMGFTATF